MLHCKPIFSVPVRFWICTPSQLPHQHQTVHLQLYGLQHKGVALASQQMGRKKLNTRWNHQLQPKQCYHLTCHSIHIKLLRVHQVIFPIFLPPIVQPCQQPLALIFRHHHQVLLTYQDHHQVCFLM